MARPRVLLADDHTLVLEGFRRLLESDFELVGSVEDGKALLAAAEELRPDIIVLDISMPMLNGIEAARHLKKTLPDTKLVILTMHADQTYAVEAFRAGASGYLLKRSAASELVFALKEVLKGRVYVTPLIAKDMMSSFLDQDGKLRGQPAKSAAELSPRQREVLQLVAEGRSNKEIATIMSTSLKTVEFHKSRIMEKLDLHTTADLTKYAVLHGIVAL
jgi:DNA-binding NarL/FixJ family response regulator